MSLILSINAGSSSVKLSLFSAEYNSTPRLILESSISNITSPPATFSYTSFLANSHDINREECPSVKDQNAAFQQFLKHFEADEVMAGRNIRFACHRIVHGGSFPKAIILSPDTIHHLDELSDLAPLHNAPALGLVRFAIEHLKNSVNIAYFDTTFHTTIPEHVYTYPLNLQLAEKKKIRKYGFHGISYAFIHRETALYLNKAMDETSLIALHLGSGASVAAICNGRSIDTSMGLTPLEGLPGATRSGSVDPSLVFHYTSEASSLSRASTKDLHISKAEDILNKHSGWASMIGITNFGSVVNGMNKDKKKKLVFDLMVDRIVGFIGNYYVKLGGKVDALTFSGGIGEGSDILRKAVVEKVSCLGFGLDEKANSSIAEEIVHDIGSSRGDKRVLVVKTDEQFEMARECAHNGLFWK